MKNNQEKSSFTPAWISTEPPQNSYRSLFKWGAPDKFKHPNQRLFAMMKEIFNMTNDDFLKHQLVGNEPVDIKLSSKLSANDLNALTKIVGHENITTDSYSRLRAAYGKTAFDNLRLRYKIAENTPDAVIRPRDRKDVKQIIDYCHNKKIAVYVFGGRSSVTRGHEAIQDGIALDMTVHMNKVIEFNETNHTIKVEPGIYGPALENLLNNAQKNFQAKRNYTCGHFPQSFEFSTVGGWIAALGSGQQSTYYGDMKDLVIAQEYITPAGEFISKEFPAAATGPSISDIFLGNEGTFGVMVSATIKIFRHLPAGKKQFSYIFHNYAEALAATREIVQAEIGKPSVFRLSDPEETDVALKLYGVEGTLIERLLNIRGYKRMERCLLIGQVDGDKSITGKVKKNIHKICKQHGAMFTTGFVTEHWEKGRYMDPYMREDLQDFGIMIDTLECTVRWDNLQKVHAGVRAFVKSRPATVCMTHSSHFYSQGTNLYFIFIAKMNEIKEYQTFLHGIINAIYENGASLSHHHGVGKMLALWFEKYLGKNELNLLRAIKKHLDPHNIMNPGGTLALDDIAPLSSSTNKTKQEATQKTTQKTTIKKKGRSQKSTKKTSSKTTPDKPKSLSQ